MGAPKPRGAVHEELRQNCCRATDVSLRPGDGQCDGPPEEPSAARVGEVHLKWTAVIGEDFGP